MWQFNLSASRFFHIPKLGQVENQIILLNMFDRTNLIQPASGIGVFQASPEQIAQVAPCGHDSSQADYSDCWSDRSRTSTTIARAAKGFFAGAAHRRRTPTINNLT